MRLSTRNQLAGTVTAITTGEAMAVVKVQLDGGPVTALIKSTEVALAVE
jgi:molybdate transport system regulatory protein